MDTLKSGALFEYVVNDEQVVGPRTFDQYCSAATFIFQQVFIVKLVKNCLLVVHSMYLGRFWMYLSVKDYIPQSVRVFVVPREVADWLPKTYADEVVEGVALLLQMFWITIFHMTHNMRMTADEKPEDADHFYTDTSNEDNEGKRI